MRTRQQLRTSVLVAVGAALLAGCGGAAGTGGANATDGPSGGGAKDDARSAQLAFTKCMRENGVDVPDPKPGTDGGMVQIGPGDGAGPDREKFAAAHDACKQHLRGAGGAGPLGALTEEDKQRMVKFAQCMRKNGVDMPDPDFSKGNGTMTLGDPDDGRFKTAHEACKQFFGPAGGAS
jgi:hypothetical protein